MSDTNLMDDDAKMQAALNSHRRWRYHGRTQGAECECHAAFYPASGHTAVIKKAHLQHIAEVLSAERFGPVAIMRQWVEENADELT